MYGCPYVCMDATCRYVYVHVCICLRMHAISMIYSVHAYRQCTFVCISSFLHVYVTARTLHTYVCISSILHVYVTAHTLHTYVSSVPSHVCHFLYTYVSLQSFICERHCPYTTYVCMSSIFHVCATTYTQIDTRTQTHNKCLWIP